MVFCSETNESVPLRGVISLFILQIGLAHVITLTWAIMKNFLLSMGFVFISFSILLLLFQVQQPINENTPQPK